MSDAELSGSRLPRGPADPASDLGSSSARASRFVASGEPFVWLTGGALAFALLMVVGLLGLVMVNGLGFFWPRDVVRLTLADGRSVLGEIDARERIPEPGAPAGTAPKWRIKVKQGNRDVYGADFVWIDETAIVKRDEPRDAVALERREWGAFFGTPKELREGDASVAQGPEAVWQALRRRLPAAIRVHDEAVSIEKGRIGDINSRKERIRLDLRQLEMKGVTSGAAVDRLKARSDEQQRQYDEQMAALQRLRDTVKDRVVFTLADGQEKEIPLSLVVRAFRPNDLWAFGKAGLYLSRVWSFVADDPRESNTEGGVFPAIFGTVMMVMIMSIIVTPLGILAAFYLREYARQGPFVSAVRIAVNNLAGVPSIVFGVFGLGFFVYFLGGSIDRVFFAEALPTPTYGTGGILWASLTLSLLTVPVVIVAAEEGLAAIPRGMREASLALGATKLETMWRVVLPAVMPAALTGLILAMARAAGEVAPLMITGVVKLAPALPLDGHAPFLHLDRKFMHLGFHIYDVGFQSPNVDAARPMVYTTTILLLLIVVALNLTAIVVRNRIRRRLRTSGL